MEIIFDGCSLGRFEITDYKIYSGVIEFTPKEGKTRTEEFDKRIKPSEDDTFLEQMYSKDIGFITIVKL